MAIIKSDSSAINNKGKIKEIDKIEQITTTDKENEESCFPTGIPQEVLPVNGTSLENQPLNASEKITKTPIPKTLDEFTSEYFNDKNKKRVWDVYSDFQTKYSKYSFPQFEKLMVLSIVRRSLLAKQRPPRNYEELQQQTPMINIAKFDETIEYCKSNTPDSKDFIPLALEVLSRNYISKPVSA
jgi:hypothetical protein